MLPSLTQAERLGAGRALRLAGHPALSTHKDGAAGAAGLGDTGADTAVVRVENVNIFSSNQ